MSYDPATVEMETTFAARIRDLRDEGYRIGSRKDDDGIAHYSLVAEPSESDGSASASTGATDVQTAEDLWRELPEGSLARDYVALLARCAKGDQRIGILEEAVTPAAVSDWEAAACIGRDVSIKEIASCREKLCRASELVQEHSHRTGHTTYRLNPALTDRLTE